MGLFGMINIPRILRWQLQLNLLCPISLNLLLLLSAISQSCVSISPVLLVYKALQLPTTLIRS